MNEKAIVRKAQRQERHIERKAKRAVWRRRVRCFWSWPFGHAYDPGFCVGCLRPKPGYEPPKPPTASSSVRT